MVCLHGILGRHCCCAPYNGTVGDDAECTADSVVVMFMQPYKISNHSYCELFPGCTPKHRVLEKYYSSHIAQPWGAGSSQLTRCVAAGPASDTSGQPE